MSRDKIAFTIQEASVASSLSRTTLYKLITGGALPSLKAAGRRLILRDDLETFLRNLREVSN